MNQNKQQKKHTRNVLTLQCEFQTHLIKVHVKMNQIHAAK